MKLDQCLFGYDDGHKLLASSISLGAEASYLTELSDLAPGAIFGSSDGYWTGVPAPAIGRYVLMRTWPAPEMPRPGCVWTHALLIEPGLLESLEDLSVLKELTVRPTSVVDIASYRSPLEVSGRASKESIAPLDVDILRRLMVSLYSKGSPPGVVSFPGEIDDCLFAVWSQQWPRLRRNLKFQSAVSRASHSSSSTRFDIMALTGGHREFLKGALDSVGSEWVDAAIHDIQTCGEDGLRHFLWVYGADVKRQRNSFRPLVELGLISTKPKMQGHTRAINIVLNAFPSFKDAARLKQDLIDGVLIESAQIDALRYFVLSSSEPVFPAPSKSGIKKLVSKWDDESEALLGLAELVAEKLDEISLEIFAGITCKIQELTFWSFTKNFPILRSRMLQENPQLLLEAGASDLADDFLAEKIHLISGDSPRLVSFIFRLFSRNSQKLVEASFEAFPKVIAAQIILAENEAGEHLDGVWRAALMQRPELLLSTDVLGQISRTSVLYEYADGLRWLGPEVFSGGSEPWVSALQKASKDLVGEKEDTLNSFVLILSLVTHDEGSSRGVELLFDTIHSKIMSNSLFGEARDILSGFLPGFEYSEDWDLGLRLRMMVAAIYVHKNWSAESFACLSKNSMVRHLLADAASNISGGKPYAKAISR